MIRTSYNLVKKYFLAIPLLAGMVAFIYLFVKMKFLLVLLAVALTGVLSIIFIPYEYIALFFIAQLVFFKVVSGFRIMGVFISYTETVFLIFLGSYFLSFLFYKRPIQVKKFGTIEFLILVLLVFVIISAIVGITNYSTSDLSFGKAFRTDLFRGPMYYVWAIFLSLLVFKDDKWIERTITVWVVFLTAHIVSYLINFVITGSKAIVIEHGAFMDWGCHLQAISYLFAFSFLMNMISKKRFWIIIASVCLLFLTVSRSRTPVVACIIFALYVVCVVSIMQQKGTRLKFFMKGLVYVCVGIALAAFIMLFLFPDERLKLLLRIFFVRAESFQALSADPALNSRKLQMIEAMAYFRHNIWLGHGFGTYYLTTSKMFFVDNFYGVILSKMGILGLVSLLSFYFTGVVLAIKQFGKVKYIKSDLIKAGILIAPIIFIMALGAGYTVSHPFYSKSTIITVCIFLALVSNQWEKNNQIQKGQQVDQ